jgi:hypothetical protein
VQSEPLSGDKLAMRPQNGAAWTARSKTKEGHEIRMAVMIYPLPHPLVAGVPFARV